MSLQVWLPLNGDLTNNGIANATISGSNIIYDTGLMGKAKTTGEVIIDKNYQGIVGSMAMWIYTSPNGDTTRIFGNDSSGTKNRKWTIHRYPTRNDLHSWGCCEDSNTTNPGSSGSFTITGALPDNKWTHIVYAHNATNGYIYVNGELRYTTSWNSTGKVYTFSDPVPLLSENGGNKICDFRLYNHCLSAKEVKELSKGLVLHYRLAGPGQENLVKNSSKYTVSNKFTMTTASTDGIMCPGIYYNNFNTTKQYTLTVECDGTLNTGHGTLQTPADRYWTIWIYYHDTPFTNTDYDRYQTPICYNSSSAGFKKISDNKYSWTFTPPKANGSIRLNTYSDGTNVITVKFWNIKIEEGSISTPWCPNPADALYTALGYSTGVEYDCSGYKHNGIPVSTTVRPTWDVDSPRYTTSFNYSGDANQANYTTSKDMNFIDNFSWAIWIKPNYVSGHNSYVFTGGRADAGGYGYGLQVVNATSCTIFYGNNGRYSINAKSGEWHHVAFTKSGTTCKCYLDGSLVSTNTFSGTDPTYSDGNGVGIGCFHYFGDIYPYFGKASDLRIYATALSDADIAELYHSAVIVDNTGKTYAYEYFET